MKLGIIGYGVVGSANAAVLRQLGHVVYVCDVDEAKQAAAERDGSPLRTPGLGIDVDFVCVPESCAASAIEGIEHGSIVVLRSTFTPGTTDRLALELGRPLLVMPEFLREATAFDDALNPHLVLIGTHDAVAGELVASIFAPLQAKTVIVTPAEAEMTKLSLNAYLHTLVSFWNEVHLICERLGLSSELIGALCANDPRVAEYGALWHGEPVLGRCLPKDLAQMIDLARDLQYAPELLLAVQALNAKTAAAATLDAAESAV